MCVCVCVFWLSVFASVNDRIFSHICSGMRSRRCSHINSRACSRVHSHIYIADVVVYAVANVVVSVVPYVVVVACCRICSHSSSSICDPGFDPPPPRGYGYGATPLANVGCLPPPSPPVGWSGGWGCHWVVW